MTAEVGDYLAQVTKAELTESKANKTPQWTLTLYVFMRAVNGAWQPIAEPFNRTANLSLHENAVKYTIKKLTALGFNGDVENPDFSDDAKVTGVVWKCGRDKKTGQYEEWDLADWGGGPSFEPAPASVKQQFAALWKSQSAPSKPAGKPAAPPPKPLVGKKAVDAETDKILDDGIPV